MKIKIRQIRPEDYNFIIKTWIKSAYNGGTGYFERYGVFHKGMDIIIKRKYESGEIDGFVACMEDDEDLILGFAVFGLDYCLHYIYVKEAFKKQGIARALLKHFYKSKTEIKVSHWTKDIKYIQKLYKVEYDRFKFFN